ncbi:MAG: acyltransferase family protein [Hydrogenophaga sp.]|nr:acyltransferase family protein [Hydrogenophaga sp.]
MNGLRAWAVVAVVLFHFGVPGFGGGFVGVDVFFVISGFLMTGIVVRGLERGGSPWFFMASFYMARARRILPALIVLCAVLLALGWWVLMPLDYKALGTHVAFSLVFLSNIKFWREAGYFDAASHEKWLLHTWSLAVEWQFYLLLPLVLLAIWKWRPGRRAVVVAMTVGLLASLALSIGATPWRPAAAFFLLPTRAWEMLAGGLVYLLAHRWHGTERQRLALEVAGMALVIGSIVGFDSASAWPGWRALVPVLGTVGLLLAARRESRWTGHPVAQWLGTRSYSIYLWHWPIVVALTYLEWQANPGAIAAGLALALVLGHLSYHGVENPARRQLDQRPLRWGAVALLAGVVAVVTPGAGIRFQEGVLGRFSPEIELVNQEAVNRNSRQGECHAGTGSGSPSCVFGGSRLSAIVMGDSHANAIVSAVAAATPNPEDGVMEWTFSGCPTMQGVKRVADSRQCGEFVDWTLQALDRVPPEVAVVIANRHAYYLIGGNETAEQANIPLVYFSRRYAASEPEFLKEYGQHLVDTACQLAKDRPVYLVRPIPEMGVDVPKMMARRLTLGNNEAVSISLADYHQRHAMVWAAQDAARDRCGVKILDPLPYLCWDGRCHGAKDGRPLYYDDDHLSEHGNKLLVPMFAEIFRAPPRASAAPKL